MNNLVTKSYITITILILAVVGSVQANTETNMLGAIYQRGSDDSLIYTQREFVEQDGDRTVLKHEYYRTDGSLAAYEEVILRNNTLSTYTSEIFDLGVYGEIRMEDEAMVISQTSDGKTKTKSHNQNETLVPGPMLQGFIAENRFRLASGESVEFHLPFFDAQRTMPFKIREKNSGDNPGIITVEMKLKNFLLGNLIDPIDFVMDMETGQILEIHGPTVLPEPGSRGKRNFLDADIYYTYDDSREAL